jgi:hypothetical protein
LPYVLNVTIRRSLCDDLSTSAPVVMYPPSLVISIRRAFAESKLSGHGIMQRLSRLQSAVTGQCVTQCQRNLDRNNMQVTATLITHSVIVSVTVRRGH